MDTRRILIVSDLHLPYQRSDAIDFLKESIEEYYKNPKEFDL